MANPVFDKLGAESDDIEALTAYALYKRHKRAWAANFENEHGRKPNVAEDDAFAKVVSTDDQLERYRKDARDILIAFANQTVEDARPQISQEAITVRMEQAAAQISSQGSWGNQIATGVISSALMTVLLIILAVGMRVSGIDVMTYLNYFGAAPTVVEGQPPMLPTTSTE